MYVCKYMYVYIYIYIYIYRIHAAGAQPRNPGERDPCPGFDINRQIHIYIYIQHNDLNDSDTS